MAAVATNIRIAVTGMLFDSPPIESSAVECIFE